MPEYLYINYNNDERRQRGKKNGVLFTNLHLCKTYENITRFYRRFSLAQLHHMTGVNLFKEGTGTAFD